MPPMLEIKNLRASVEGREILKGVDLTVNAGEVHALLHSLKQCRNINLLSISCGFRHCLRTD